ncbi:MAG: hypothetical protein K0R93_2864 [Anaerosolibacter sp.]|uniref:hypothetical protein n=1 Tax=Anaerosolibacter sp. TaxID=1872527 RepID=UPI0026376AA5|nr:hypothetical protein [Anaerosolibacter sp.]MDF2547966.1 hypothetical protein [Anaerosolibacter sp.]
MDHVISGIMLTLIGFFLGFITYKRYSFFWDFLNTKLLRKLLGDTATVIALYVVSIMFIATGILVSSSILK